MQAAGWNPDFWRETLSQAMALADLGQSDLVALSGISQATASRWVRGESQPQYSALKRLVDGLVQRAPALGDLSATLLTAAGYGDKEYRPPTAQSAWEEELRQAREAATAVEDPEQRRRIENIIDRELKETADLLQRRGEHLREIIDLVLKSGMH